LRASVGSTKPVPIPVIVRLKARDTIVEVWTGPTGRDLSARSTDVVRYSARAGESVPIERDGSEFGPISVVDLIARQAEGVRKSGTRASTLDLARYSSPETRHPSRENWIGPAVTVTLVRRVTCRPILKEGCSPDLCVLD
jgi:hypothetical protein